MSELLKVREVITLKGWIDEDKPLATHSAWVSEIWAERNR